MVNSFRLLTINTWKGDLQDYYQPVRRCGKIREGKHTMLVLNAVASAIRSE